jgi:hypothetical protein
VTARLYEIAVSGRLAPRFADALPGFSMDTRVGGTVFRGWVHDEAALLSALDALSNFGLELMSLRCLDEVDVGSFGEDGATPHA